MQDRIVSVFFARQYHPPPPKNEHLLTGHFIFPTINFSGSNLIKWSFADFHNLGREKRYGASAVWLQGRLYVVGGSHHFRTSPVFFLWLQNESGSLKILKCRLDEEDLGWRYLWQALCPGQRNITTLESMDPREGVWECYDLQALEGAGYQSESQDGRQVLMNRDSTLS